MHKDSYANTFIVAGALCLVCSLLVSGAAVILKPIQDANVLNDRRMNILLATGDFKREDLTVERINEIFETKIDDRIILLETGEDVTDSLGDAEKVSKYDQVKASKSNDDSLRLKLGSKEDLAQIKNVELKAHVYIYTNDSGESFYIFPIRGKGLWSTLKGFIALKSDLRTIAGLTYYEHKETPGLGGEVDNPTWKAKWTQGKCICDETGKVRISVVTPESDPMFKVVSLSGATITSRGVENMIKFWMGEYGFEKYIERVRAENASGSDNPSASQNGDD